MRRITGTIGDDRISGNSRDDFIRGLRGNDRIFARSGDDIILAGAGDDLVRAGDGNDIVRGNAGSDILFGGGGNDDIRGGDGNDRVIAGGGNDILRGGAGNDRLESVSVEGQFDDDIVNGAYRYLFTQTALNNDQFLGPAGPSIAFGGVLGDYSISLTIDDGSAPTQGIVEQRVTLDSFALTLEEYPETEPLLFGDVLIGGPGDDVFFADADVTTILDFGRGDDTLIVDGELTIAQTRVGAEVAGQDAIATTDDAGIVVFDIDGGERTLIVASSDLNAAQIIEEVLPPIT